MDILANKVVNSVISRYSSLTSYSDIAVVETTFNIGSADEWSSKVLLRTIFDTPTSFRFDRRIGMKTKEKSMVVWFDGHHGYKCGSSSRPQDTSGVFSGFYRQERLINDCLISCSLFSGDVDRIIHPLFFPHLVGTCNLRKAEWICDLTPESYCLKSPRLSILVERESFLVSKIEDLTLDSETRSNTTFLSRTINPKIEPAVFQRNSIIEEIRLNQILGNLRSEIGPLFNRRAGDN